MNILEAYDLGQELMDDFGLEAWTLELDNSKRRFGVCKHATHTISLSIPLVTINERYQVEDTIRHEIAHALAGSNAGHGSAWKEACRRVGATPSACYSSSDVDLPETTLYLVCETCGHKSPRYRRGRTGLVYTHKGCGGYMSFEGGVNHGG